MAVITTDVLIKGVRRDHVFDWLADARNHESMLDGAFDKLTRNGDGDYDLVVSAALRARTMGYRFEGADSSHGGRRILVSLTGKRTRGKLHYSLRTLKPSTNTLVTCHMDYDPGTMLGMVINAAGLREQLEQSWSKVLANLDRTIPRS